MFGLPAYLGSIIGATGGGGPPPGPLDGTWWAYPFSVNDNSTPYRYYKTTTDVDTWPVTPTLCPDNIVIRRLHLVNGMMFMTSAFWNFKYSVDGGTTWLNTNLTDFEAGAQALFPITYNGAYYVFGKYRSADGITWEELPIIPGTTLNNLSLSNSLGKIVMPANVTGDPNGWVGSTDNGSNWSEELPITGYRGGDFLASFGPRMYFSTLLDGGGSIRRLGVTTTTLTSGTILDHGNTDHTPRAVLELSTGTLLLVTSSNSITETNIYRSTNGGSTFFEVASFAYDAQWQSFTTDNSSIILGYDKDTGGAGLPHIGFMKSTDDGETWADSGVNLRSPIGPDGFGAIFIPE